MKLTIVLICFFVCCPPALFCQFANQNFTDYMKTFEDAKIASESKTEEVINENQVIIEKLSPLNIRTGALSKYIESLPVSDLLNIIEKRNKAYEEDLFKPGLFSLKYDENIYMKYSADSISFGVYEDILRRRVEELYGDAFASLILSPIVLKIKIVGHEKTERSYLSNDNWVGLLIHTAEIEDIIKGSNHFNIGDNIQFYYIPFWVNKTIKFTDKDSYFLSLLPVTDNKTGEQRLALNVNEINGGAIKISEDIVLDEENYYQLGKLTWSDFKAKISSLINVNQLKGDIK